MRETAACASKVLPRPEIEGSTKIFFESVILNLARILS